MFSKFYIDNFRVFNNAVFDLSRINILIGENSSGKSSFLKLLLALKQTLQAPNISNLILNGELVDLGNYKEAISSHDNSKNLSFGFSFNKQLLLNYFCYYFDVDDKDSKGLIKKYKKVFDSDTFIKFELKQDLESHLNIYTGIVNENLGNLTIAIEGFNPTEDMNTGENLCNIRYEKNGVETPYIFNCLRYEKKGFLSIVESTDLQREIKRLKLDDEIFTDLAILLFNQNIINLQLQYNTNYLNPLDTKPERLYFNRDAQTSYKKSNLDKFVNLIMNERIASDYLLEFSNILRDYGIVDDLLFTKAKELPVTEVRVRINDIISNIKDVGYGVSLQIPILFESFLNEKDNGCVMLIEQPEVHLHPKLQARFIDVLLGMGNNNQYIIETHSEHLIRMLQVLVKNKKITPEEVNIYYFSKENNNFRISSHKILENGFLDKKFPEGFFDNSYKLTKSLMF